MSDMMTVHEVADYLRVKERKIYDLINQKQIPCTRVTGKWLFPRYLIDISNSQFKTLSFIMLGFSTCTEAYGQPFSVLNETGTFYSALID